MFQVAIIFVAERKATAVVAGLARVQRPYSAASRSLATPATDYRCRRSWARQSSEAFTVPHPEVWRLRLPISA